MRFQSQRDLLSKRTRSFFPRPPQMNMSLLEFEFISDRREGREKTLFIPLSSSHGKGTFYWAFFFLLLCPISWMMVGGQKYLVSRSINQRDGVIAQLYTIVQDSWIAKYSLALRVYDSIYGQDERKNVASFVAENAFHIFCHQVISDFRHGENLLLGAHT